MILIDARKGVLTQTRRHSYLVSLLGIRHAVLAVNKMDLVDYSAADASPQIDAGIPSLRQAEIGLKHVVSIPISGPQAATTSRQRSAATRPGIQARRLMRPPGNRRRSRMPPRARPLRFPVQWVNRPNADFRGYQRARSRAVRSAQGDLLRVLPAGRESRVARNRDGRWRPRERKRLPASRSRMVLDRRDRYQPRRHARGGRLARRDRRPVRGDDRVDGRPPGCCPAGPIS